MSFFTSQIRSLNNIIHIENDINSSEAFTRIEQEAIYVDKIDRKDLWGNFARNEPISSSHSLLEKVISQFEIEDIKEKTALDLGCGKAASTLYLLEKGWKVIAVDYSKEALTNLEKVANQINPEWIKKGQLNLVCEDIDTYKLPKNITLIVASRIFPYIHPLKISKLWDKIYNSLTPKGRIVGDFFSWCPFPQMRLAHRALMGAWFTDIASVRALLDQKKYEKEILEHSAFFFSSTRNIEFIARKGTQRSNTWSIPLYLSSYFNAIRGLPSKRLFSHAYPFLVDRMIELREAGKLMVLASGAVALTQSLFQSDAMIASYAFVGSIGAWFLFKKFAERMETPVQSYIHNVRRVDYKDSPELAAVLQEIKKIQDHEKVQKLFSPPPPFDPQKDLSPNFLEIIKEKLNLSPVELEELLANGTVQITPLDN